jgi:hypothetical protein
MRTFSQYFVYLFITVSIMSCRDYSSVPRDSAGNKITENAEQQLPLSEFQVYRGNSHSHTIFTWTHGWFRATDTEFDTTWNIPPGMDPTDHTTINMNPEFYTNQQGLPANHFERAHC